MTLQDNEFVCFTCASNKNIEAVDQAERNTPLNKHVWINLRSRRTNKVGLCFTKDSIMYFMHIEKFDHHDWFNVGQEERRLEQEKQDNLKQAEILQNELDYYLKVSAE